MIQLSGTKRRLVTNTLTGWVAMGCKMAIALVMVPFLLKHLGKDGYGLIGLMGVIVSFSTVADMGLRQALGRELSEKVANDDAEGFRVLSSTALLLYLGIASVLIIAGWVLAPWFATVFKVPDELFEPAVWMIRLYGSGSMLLSFITPVFTAGLQSFLRFDSVNWVKTAGAIAAGILLFVCISFFDISPLIIWAVVMFGILLFDLIAQLFLYKKHCFSGKLGPSYVRFGELRSLFHLGGYMYVVQLTNAISERSDPLVVSCFFGTAGLALYQAGAKLTQMLRPIVLTLSTQVHPLTTRFHVLDQQDKQRQVLILGTRYTLLFGVFFSAGIILFAEQFCRLWLFDTLGADYLTVARVMQLWAVANILDYAAAMHWPLVLGVKKLRFTMAVQVPSAIINIILAIYLVGYTSLGIPGALVGTILVGLVRRPLTIWYVSKITNLPLKKYISEGYAPPLIFLALLLAFYYIGRVVPVSGWGGLVLSGMLFGFYGALLLAVIERRLVVSFLHQWRPNKI